MRGGRGRLGVSGYVPSLEAFTFVASVAEEGSYLAQGANARCPWASVGLRRASSPYDELPMRVNRIAYREFSRNPDLKFERCKNTSGGIFGEAPPADWSKTC